MSEDQASAGGSELQFDQVAYAQGPPAPGRLTVECAECHDSISTEYFTINDRVVCDRCRTTIERLAEPPRGAGPVIRAALFGLGAGIAGAAVYYAVLALANLEIGIVAILIGYMVGGGVKRGARGRGGRRFQIVAVVLTYLSVAMAYVPVVIQAAIKDRQTRTATTGTATAGTSKAGQPSRAGETAEPAAPPRPPSLAGSLMGLAMLAGLLLSLPVLIVFGGFPMSLISALIIFVGLRQAWQMTASPTIEVFGPYRVGAAAAEAGV